MISIISNPNDLITLGFYKAFKTIYSDVSLITYISQYKQMKDSKIIIINKFNNIMNIIYDKNKKYIILKRNEKIEKIFKELKINYYIIYEYDDDFSYDNFIQKEKFMYIMDKIIIMPYFSIYTKNEILFNYKHNIVRNIVEKENFNKKNDIIMIKNDHHEERKKYKLPKLKIFNCLSSIQQKRLITDHNLFISFSKPNNFDCKSISYMSLGSLSITNSLLNKKYIFNSIHIDEFKNNIKNFNYNSKQNLIMNIQEIYNDYTFEKYVKILDKILK